MVRGSKYFLKTFFIFDTWFAYKIPSNDAKDLGGEFIGIVKTNTKSFCKDTTKNRKIISRKNQPSYWYNSQGKIYPVIF